MATTNSEDRPTPPVSSAAASRHPTYNEDDNSRPYYYSDEQEHPRRNSPGYYRDDYRHDDHQQHNYRGRAGPAGRSPDDHDSPPNRSFDDGRYQDRRRRSQPLDDRRISSHQRHRRSQSIANRCFLSDAGRGVHQPLEVRRYSSQHDHGPRHFPSLDDLRYARDGHRSPPRDDRRFSPDDGRGSSHPRLEEYRRYSHHHEERRFQPREDRRYSDFASSAQYDHYERQYRR